MDRFGSSSLVVGPVMASLVAVGALAGCSTATGAATTVDLAPIVIGESDDRESLSQQATIESDYDPRADLDIEDQRGDGSSIAIESVRVTRDGVYLVIMDERGVILGTKPLPPGVQPVQMVLERSIQASGDLVGVLILDDGDGEIDLDVDPPLLDGDGDMIEEDFEYYVA